MTQQFFILPYRLDRAERYLIAISNDTDGVVTLPDGKVPSFSDREALRSYAASHQIQLDAMELLGYELDAAARWLRRSRPSKKVDCAALLNAWNLFIDISLSVGGNFDPDRERTEHVYEKLFWGNNLPAVTPPGKYYVPLWNDDEILLIQEVLNDGLTLFRKCISKL